MKVVKNSRDRLTKVKNKCQKIDLFEEQVPNFRLNGKEKRAGWCGTLVSTLFVLLIVIYAWLKFDQFYKRFNPNISSRKLIAELDDSVRVNLYDSRLKFAFFAENADVRESIDDSRYVRFISMLNGYKDGENYSFPLKHHKCSDKEIEKLATPTQLAQDQLDEIMASDKRNLYCLDWD